MNSGIVLLLIAIGLFLGWAIWTFNRLVRDRNRVRAGYSDIDVQLQRRHDLVPQLVESLRGYASHERNVFDEVTRLRSNAIAASDVDERDRAESALAERLQRLFALAESYPDLKADKNFRQLMTELVEVEDHLQHARRYYNGAVRAYNTRAQQFPDLLVAAVFGFRPEAFFSAEIESRVPPVIRGFD